MKAMYQISLRLMLVLLAGLSASNYADSKPLNNDPQWLCDNQEAIFARVDEGDSAAYYEAGMLFFQGVCVESNYPFAFSLFVDAAKQGYEKAYHPIGLMSHMGLGTQKDLASADKIF